MNLLASLINLLERHHGTVARTAMGLVLLGGLMYSILMGDAIRYPDEQEYHTIASHVVELGRYSLDGETPTAYRPPGYPLFQTVFIMPGGGVALLRFLNFMLLAATIGLVYRLGLRHASPAFAALACLWFLAYPVLLYTAGTLYPQTFGAFLYVLFLWLLFKDEQLPAARAMVAGLVLGVLVLAIPTFLVIGGLTAAFIMVQRRSLLGPALIMSAMVLVMAPWIIRNQQAFGTFIPVSTNSGINLLLGNHENTRANSGVNVDLGELVQASSHMDELEQDAFFKAEAKRFISEDPARAMRLYVAKFANHFNWRSELATASEGSAAKDLLMLLTYSPLLLVLLGRLILLRRLPPSPLEWYLLGIYLVNAGFQAIFFTRIRFRLPFDVLLILLGAILLHRLWLERSQRSSKANK